MTRHRLLLSCALFAASMAAAPASAQTVCTYVEQNGTTKNCIGVQSVAGGGAPSATVATAQVSATTSAVTVLAANTNRRGCTLYYDATAIMYLVEGSGTPTATNFTYKLGSGYYTAYECPTGYTGAVRAVWSAATGSVNTTERTQ